MAKKIKQPKNAAIKAKKAEVDLVWKQTFGKEQTARFNTVQKVVDSECIKRMEEYTPKRSGYLSHGAPKNGTVIGSGHIYYEAPYARYQYYGIVYGPNIPIYEYGELIGFWSPKKKHSTGKPLQYDKSRHPKAQRLWFEQMKTEHSEAILRKAARIAGGKPK